MKFLFFLFLILLTHGISAGQILNLDWNDYQLTDPNFNTSYIKNFRIKSIYITYQYKPANERIFTKNIKQIIEFNNYGLPERSFFVSNANTQPDTQITWYIYSSQNYLRLKRSYDKNGYYSEYFEHDPAGFLTKYSKVKEQNLNKNPLLFKPGYQEVLWTESYKYEFFGKEKYKRICINDIGQPYKQQVFSVDKNGNKISVYTTFIVTSTASEEEIKYNDRNQITEKTYFANTGNYLSEIYKYEYKNDRPDKEFYYLNSRQAYERFYFYSEKGLLESDLKKLPNGDMDIIKYEYSYY